MDPKLHYSYEQLSGNSGVEAKGIFEEWRLAHSMNEFREWLDHGAPSDDASAAESSSDREAENDS